MNPEIPEKGDSTTPAVEVLPPEGGREGDTGAGAPWAPAAGGARFIWGAVALFMGVYIFVPEPTDLFPPLGWLDEGLAVMILTYALEKLGVRIPLLDAFLRRRRR